MGLFVLKLLSCILRFLEELAARSDDKVFTTERDRHDSPVPRKKIKTLKPDAILEGKELWNCFYRLGTEMIITKTGRSVKVCLLHVRAIR